MSFAVYGTIECGVFEGSCCKVGTTKVGFKKVGTTKVGFKKVGSTKVSSLYAD